MALSRKKLLVGGLVLVAAVGYLTYAGIRQGGSYYLTVDAFLADAQYHQRQVRVLGTVAEDGLTVDPGQQKASFQLVGQTSRLSVTYSGVVPDMFRAGGEVVVEGRLGDDRVFHATRLLTKCASKYDRADRQTGRPA